MEMRADRTGGCFKPRGRRGTWSGTALGMALAASGALSACCSSDGCGEGLKEILKDQPPLTAASAVVENGSQVMARGGTPTILHVDNESIYVVDHIGGAVFKLSKDGTSLAEWWRPKKDKPTGVYGDDDSVFVAVSGQLVRISKKDKQTQVIRTDGWGQLRIDPGPTSKGMIFVGGDAVSSQLSRFYNPDNRLPIDGAFTHPEKPSSIPHGPKTATEIKGKVVGYVLYYAVDEEHIYYTGREPGVSGFSSKSEALFLYRRPRAGGEFQKLRDGCCQYIALGATEIYCATGETWNQPNQVFMLPKTGGEGEKVFETKGTIQGLHADGKDAYAHGFSGVAQRWDVRKIEKGKLEGRLLAVEDHMIGSVTTDATHVYWTNKGAWNGETHLRAGAVKRHKR